MGVVAPPQAPPFPFTVEQFLAEVCPPSAAATASQACAAFAQLATKVVVPETFRAAVPAVLGLVAREGDGLLEAKESALASLVALLACVPGAAEDAAAHGAVASVLAACEAAPGGRWTATPWAFRILCTADAAATATVSDDAAIGPLIAFVKARAVGANRGRAIATTRPRTRSPSPRWTCCAGSRRSGGTAARRDAVVRARRRRRARKGAGRRAQRRSRRPRAYRAGDDHRARSAAGGAGRRARRVRGPDARDALAGRPTSPEPPRRCCRRSGGTRRCARRWLPR